MTYWRIWLGVLALLSLVMLRGDGGKKHCMNYQSGVPTNVYIKLKDCWDMPGGQYMCRNALFDPQVVRVK